MDDLCSVEGNNLGILDLLVAGNGLIVIVGPKHASLWAGGSVGNRGGFAEFVGFGGPKQVGDHTEGYKDGDR